MLTSEIQNSQSARRVAIFGSTGSIGTQTLDIVEKFPNLFEVVALTAGRNIELLKKQIRQFSPQFVCTVEPVPQLAQTPEFSHVTFFHGEAGLEEVATLSTIDVFVVGIVGFAALKPALTAVRSGKTIALANKEVLVVAGKLLQQESKKFGSTCIPVDSEHNALYQLLLGQPRSQIQSLVLTASGGPLLKLPDLPLEDVTPAVAIKHPNWKMGPKISVDSATLMNKGLELIEACFLFDFSPSQVEIWVHPQSIVHGAIWLTDNTCLAQLSKPNMRSSIGYALQFPDRLPGVIPKLSFGDFSRLDFFAPDHQRFPAITIAREALESGPSHLIALNAGNEIVVEAFLAGQILFPQMSTALFELLGQHVSCPVDCLEDIFDIDRKSRESAAQILKTLKK